MIDSPRVALLREVGGWGDVTQCLAVARARKARGPCRITFFAGEAYAEWVGRCPDVDEVWTVRRPEARKLLSGESPHDMSYFRAAGQFQEVIDLWCPASAHEQETAADGLLVTKDRLHCFLDAAGLPFAGLAQVRTTRDEDLWLDGYIAGALGPDAGKPYTVLAPRGVSPIRNWRKERWRAVIAYLEARGIPVVSLGEGYGGIEIGKQPYWTIAGILKRAALLLAVDTGPLHVAGLYDVPTLGLFGMTDGEITCRPYPQARWIQGQGCPTGPCYYSTARGRSWECDVKGCRAMLDLSASRVLEALEPLAEGWPQEQPDLVDGGDAPLARLLARSLGEKHRAKSA